jgi:hypothetical protein
MSNTCNGLSLELRPRSVSYRQGELPSFDAVLSNSSGASIVFCAYKAHHRLLSKMHADGWAVMPFRPTPRDAVAGGDFLTLAPGESKTFPLELPKVVSEGYRLVWAGSQAPIINEIQAAHGFPSGTFHFGVHLGDFISFYTAPSGQCGPLERIHIVRDVPKVGAAPAQVWSGDLIAECVVNFS